MKGQYDSVLHQNSGTGFSQPAKHTVLLNCNENATVPGSLYNGIRIQGFDGVHTDDPAGYTLFLKVLCCQKRPVYRFASSDKAYIAPFMNDDGPADLKIRACWMQVEHRFFTQADIDGSGMRCCGPDRLVGFKIVGRCDDVDVVDSPQHGVIMQRVMRGA